MVQPAFPESSNGDNIRAASMRRQPVPQAEELGFSALYVGLELFLVTFS